MKPKHTVLDGKHFIKVEASGGFDLEESKRALRRLLQDPKFPEDSDIVIDLRESDCELGLADVFEVVQFMVEHRRAFFRKIALLAGGETELDKARFMELCARNRGLQVRAFSELPEAKAWLAPDGQGFAFTTRGDPQ